MASSKSCGKAQNASRSVNFADLFFLRESSESFLLQGLTFPNFEQITHALHARLGLAAFKMKYNITHVPFHVLEAQSATQDPEGILSIRPGSNRKQVVSKIMSRLENLLTASFAQYTKELCDKFFASPSNARTIYDLGEMRQGGRLKASVDALRNMDIDDITAVTMLSSFLR